MRHMCPGHYSTYGKDDLLCCYLKVFISRNQTIAEIQNGVSIFKENLSIFSGDQYFEFFPPTMR